MFMRKSILAISALSSLLLCAPINLRADEEGDQLQRLLTKQSATVASIKVVVKTVVSGASSQDSESTAETQGVVVAPDGLIMLSNDSFSSNRLKTLLGSLGDAAKGFDMKMTPTSFKIVFENDDKEYNGFLAASDNTLGLAFVQVEGLGDKKLSVVDFSGTATPTLGQKLVSISRMSKGFDYAPFYSSARVSGEITKPRKAYLSDGSLSGNGIPVYALTGETLGVQITLVPTLKNEGSAEAASLNMVMRMFGGAAAPTHAFILPNTTLLPIITQAKQRAIVVAEEHAKNKVAKTSTPSNAGKPNPGSKAK